MQRPGWGRRLIGCGFRLLYHELAWSYDAAAGLVSLGQWRAWGRTALPHLVGERVLELGHGPGRLLVELTKQGFRPVGLDLSPQMGRLARRRLRRNGQAAPLVRAPAQRLPFSDGAFDSLVATFPTAYIVDPATLTEAARVLRPGGRLIIVLGARLSGRDVLSRGIEALYRITGQREVVDENEWQPLFGAAGLSVRAVDVRLPHSQVSLWVVERANQDDRTECVNG